MEIGAVDVKMKGFFRGEITKSYYAKFSKTILKFLFALFREAPPFSFRPL